MLEQHPSGSPRTSPLTRREMPTFLKGESFYTKTVSASLLCIVATVIWTFVHILRLLHRPPTEASGDTLVLASILASFLLGIFVHRSRVRHILRKRAPEELLLSEMASLLLIVTLALCVVAAIAAR
jgi:hypothetical protein